jgi:hypothetical protein
MSKTYAKGRKGFKRVDHKHGHCYMCGYDPREKGRKRTELRNYMKFHVLAEVI